MVDKFFADVLPFFKDERYIKIDNKPFFILYHYDKFKPEELREVIARFNELAKENGLGGIYFVGQGYQLDEQIVKVYGLDAVSEFSPCGMKFSPYEAKEWVNPDFTGNMFDVSKLVLNKEWIYDVNYPLYKGVFTAWDNTARSFLRSNIYRETSPALYKQWLKDTIVYTKERNAKDKQIVFVNAWNEWGEGAHLEPDLRYGYAFLEATREAIEETR